MKEKKNKTRKRADRFALWLLRYNGGLLNMSDVIKKYREIMDIGAHKSIRCVRVRVVDRQAFICC